MKRFSFINLFFNLLVALFIGSVVGQSSDANTFAVAGGVVVAGATYHYLKPAFAQGMAYMAIQKEMWQNHIEEEIFKDNSFLKYAHSATENVIDGAVVHIPQSGGSGNVVKNRKNLPAQIRQRKDHDVVYVLDEFTSDPVVIPNIDEHELSYDKRNSVLGEDRDNLVQTVAEEMLLNWVSTPAYGAYSATTIPSGSVLSTTGADGVGNATAPGATGDRKTASTNDLQTMRTAFVRENRWFGGKMYAMLPPQMLAEMFPADSVITATYMQSVTEEERRNGVLYKCQGWNIMDRSSVYVVADDGTIKAPGEAGVSTDDEAGLFWYSEAVEMAMGSVKMFEDLDQPTMYGDVYSFLVRTGGRARRSDYKGIKMLKQDKV